jgi:hypothetical protein
MHERLDRLTLVALVLLFAGVLSVSGQEPDRPAAAYQEGAYQEGAEQRETAERYRCELPQRVHRVFRQSSRILFQTQNSVTSETTSLQRNRVNRQYRKLLIDARSAHLRYEDSIPPCAETLNFHILNAIPQAIATLEAIRDDRGPVPFADAFLRANQVVRETMHARAFVSEQGDTLGE